MNIEQDTKDSFSELDKAALSRLNWAIGVARIECDRTLGIVNADLILRYAEMFLRERSAVAIELEDLSRPNISSPAVDSELEVLRRQLDEL